MCLIRNNYGWFRVYKFYTAKLLFQQNFTSADNKRNEKNLIKSTKRLYNIQNINIPGLPPPAKRARMRGAGKEYTTLSKL